jgi:hypothetical protein
MSFPEIKEQKSVGFQLVLAQQTPKAASVFSL